MELHEMIEAVQRALGVQVDGRAGTETWGAIYAALVQKSIAGSPPEQAIAKVDDRSEANITTLLPEVQPLARALVQKAATNGIQIKVISGLRTYAEQDALYAKGRSAWNWVWSGAAAGHQSPTSRTFSCAHRGPRH